MNLRTLLSTLTIFILALLAPAYAQAQITANPQKAYEFGLQAGSLLPSRIFGVREIVPGWSPSISVPSRMGTFQLGGFFGRGRGLVYNALDFDFRMDLLLESMPMHFYLGGHLDQYEGVYGKSKLTGGWHFGGGATQDVYGPIALRGDFRSRYGPGRSLEILVGVVYRLSETGN